MPSQLEENISVSAVEMAVVKVNLLRHVTLPMWDEGCSWLCDVVVKVLFVSRRFAGFKSWKGDSWTAFQWMVC